MFVTTVSNLRRWFSVVSCLKVARVESRLYSADADGSVRPASIVCIESAGTGLENR